MPRVAIIFTSKKLQASSMCTSLKQSLNMHPSLFQLFFNLSHIEEHMHYQDFHGDGEDRCRHKFAMLSMAINTNLHLILKPNKRATTHCVFTKGNKFIESKVSKLVERMDIHVSIIQPLLIL